MKQIGSFFLLPKRYGVFPYIFLLYLIFPVLSVQNQSETFRITGYVLVAVFILIYRQLYWSKMGKTYNVLLLAMMLIIAAFGWIGGLYNLYLVFFPVNFIGWIEHRKTFNRFVLLCAVLVGTIILINLEGLTVTDLISLFPIVVILLLIPFGLRSLNRQMELRHQLDAANEQIGELMKRDERMRIARDLHDTLGHTLSLITLKSQLVERLVLKNPERAQHEAKEIQETSRAALRQVRELVSEMRAIKVSEELVEACEMLRAAEIVMHTQGEPALPGVSDLTQSILSLCLKEAVTNVVKHSRARECTVTVRQNESEVELKVEDDGVGPYGKKTGEQTEKADRKPGRGNGLDDIGGGNGLRGMRERLALIEGTLELSPRQGRGTSLSVKIPLVVREQQGGDPV